MLMVLLRPREDEERWKERGELHIPHWGHVGGSGSGKLRPERCLSDIPIALGGWENQMGREMGYMV